mgnify:CR=1 FL=1
MKQIETLVFDYGGVIVNIDDVSVVMKQLGYSTDELFDEVFLSYAMRKEKPSVEIYEEMAQQTGLNPSTTLYFDDRKEASGMARNQQVK